MSSALPARANTITFDTASVGPLTSPQTEAGFTYSTASGYLDINGSGDPGDLLEGNAPAIADHGGTVKFVSAGLSPYFNFVSVDFSAFDEFLATSQPLVVTGLLNNVVIGTDTYTAASTHYNSTQLNWTLETASSLAGQKIDELLIRLDAGVEGGGGFYTEAIDNVILTPLAGVPEPGGLLVFAAGLLGLGIISSRWSSRR